MVAGSREPKFTRVWEEFERNFAERGEIGASVCVMVDGEPVVDLWGGVANRADGREWARDTVSVVFSTTKGVTALCAHLRLSRGQLDLAAPVVTYWPEFGKAGKEEITVGAALEAERPAWEPGTRHGYHALTFGAEPESLQASIRMSFGYTMNAMGPGTLLNTRDQSLVDAVYTALGHTECAAEVWR